MKVIITTLSKRIRKTNFLFHFLLHDLNSTHRFRYKFSIYFHYTHLLRIDRPFYLFIYLFFSDVVRHLRTTIIRGDRTRRWQWSVYVTKKKKKQKEEEKGGRGRRGGVEEETKEERRFTNGQQLVVYSFGHGFLDTGLDRCYQPIYQNRSVLLYLLLFLASTTVDETGPVAHFPFVSHQLLLLRIILS